MADLLQVEKLTSAQPRVTFYSDGVATDLDASAVPTVTLTKPDGTPGPASGPVTSVGTGTYKFTLAASGTSEVTVYTVTWQGTIGGQSQTIVTYIEVVGVFIYTIAALRAVKVGIGFPFNTTDFPNQVVLDRRVEVTDDFEAKAGWSFVPRFTREKHSGDGSSTLIVRSDKPGRLLSVTVDGTAQTVGSFDLTPDGVLTWFGGTFPATRPGNVVVEYVRGWDRSPAKIASDALAVTASWLLPSQAGSTASSWTTPDGTTYSYDQAGQRFGGGGRRFYGIPKVDADLNDPAYSTRGGVFA